MKLLYVLILFFAGLISTSMASKGPRGHRGQERRTSSCTTIRIFNQQLKVCLRDARTQNRILEDKNNESMETIKELEIKNQNLEEAAKQCDEENRILEDKNNESMETIQELEIQNQNLEEEAKQCDEENRNCMINNDILKEEIKSLEEIIECKYWPQSYKTLSCSTQLRLKFIRLINVNMPIIVDNFTFISRINDWLVI